jgi:myo-inositol 2-dehydrogenase / D-chiro-inositol 1-dehydrogenase
LTILGVGIVGLGQLAREVHLRLLASMPHVRIRAIADPDGSAISGCRPLAPQAQACESLAEMLTLPDIDAILIASPTGEHAAGACAAIEAGRSVYLEKPIAATLSDGMRVHETARRSARSHMTGFNYRFHPLAERICQSVQPAVGSISSVRSTFTIAPRDLPAWKRKRASGGGVLLDLAAHHFDLLPFLIGSPVQSVRARIWSERTEDDCAAVELMFENGVNASGEYSFCRREQDSIVISGSNGSMTYDRYAPLRYPMWPMREFLSYQIERRGSPWKEVSFRRSLEAWIGSVRGGVTPPVTIADGLQSLQVVAAAEASASSGERVAISDVRATGAGAT